MRGPLTKVTNLFNLWKVYKARSFFIVVAAILGFAKKESILTTRSNLKFQVLLSSRDFTPIAELLLSKPYDFVLGRKDVKNILDCGAHIGAFTIIAAKAYPKATIYAFEPGPETYKRLEKNIKLNKVKNVKPFNLALSDKKGYEYLHIKKGNSVVSSLDKDSRDDFTEKVKVKTELIGNLMAKLGIHAFDVVKMDCEGKELPILQNASKKGILKNSRYVVIDSDDTLPEFEKINSLLKKEGFKFTDSGISYIIQASQ
ncbi:FkbM family methyltransferase [Nanoarchaeota archaeon]